MMSGDEVQDLRLTETERRTEEMEKKFTEYKIQNEEWKRTMERNVSEMDGKLFYLTKMLDDIMNLLKVVRNTTVSALILAMLSLILMT